MGSLHFCYLQNYDSFQVWRLDQNSTLTDNNRISSRILTIIINDTCKLNSSPSFGVHAHPPQGKQCDYCCLSQGLCEEVVPSGHCSDPSCKHLWVGQERWIEQRQDNILQTQIWRHAIFRGNSFKEAQRPTTGFTN